MLTDFEKFKIEALGAIESAKDNAALEIVENKLLGRKQGEFTVLMKSLVKMSDADKKTAGAQLNEIKNQLTTAIDHKRSGFESASYAQISETEKVDLTAPSLPSREFGHLHPNTLVQRDLENLFISMGFVVLDGPEIESDYYNFTALNIPETHPARDSQDTFYIKGHPDWVMRTHTSPMQIRAMQKFGAPLRVVIPGKCYRNEATDVRHDHTFYQFEGLVVDEGINFSHLKGILEIVTKHLYGENAKVRLRPKYYPFVEPGVNGEVTCFNCSGKGCRLCKNSGWLEVFGAGMVHPNVLTNGGIDSKKYTGFAFGFGLTRLVMLKYGIDDVRLLESGNLKFLEQF